MLHHQCVVPLLFSVYFELTIFLILQILPNFFGSPFCLDPLPFPANTRTCCQPALGGGAAPSPQSPPPAFLWPNHSLRIFNALLRMYDFYRARISLRLCLLMGGAAPPPQPRRFWYNYW